jgi:hypothetical protein
VSRVPRPDLGGGGLPCPPDGPASSRPSDVAAFVFGSPDAWSSRLRRVRFLRDVSGCRAGAFAAFLEAVDRRVAALAARARWRREFWRATPDFMTTFRAARPRREAFKAADLLSGEGTTLVRRLPDRENRTLGRGTDKRPLYFVKVFPRTKSGWSPAMREFAAVDLFQRAGILVNRLAAYAEDVEKGSMVAVAAARGEPLDDLLRRGVSVPERRALAVETARIWRRMRECGLRHRDAYPCHLFAAPWLGTVPASGTVPALSRSGDRRRSVVTAGTVPEAGTVPWRHELRLIDMTRAGRAPFPKERWFVKDAAALWHGLPKPPVTRTDAVRWLREYFRIDRLDARAKRFARRVASKEARIAARQARKSKR